jgi:hypothetical protein
LNIPNIIKKLQKEPYPFIFKNSRKFTVDLLSLLCDQLIFENELSHNKNKLAGNAHRIGSKENLKNEEVRNNELFNLTNPSLNKVA